MYSKNDYRYYLENQLTHSDDFLAHYGVKGMKWKNHNPVEEIAKNALETKRSKEIANLAVLRTEHRAEKVGNAIQSGIQKNKKKSIKKRISNIRRKYGLYHIKPKGKKLKGSNIYVSHD